MAASTKNFLSLLTLTILVVGTFCTVMIIFSETNVIGGLNYEQYYLIGQAVSATAVVFLLMYLTATSTTKASAYKVFIMFILLSGLIAEIILMNIQLEGPNIAYGKYVLIAFNFLYRAYCILEYIQEPWAELTFEGINSVVPDMAPSGDSSSTPATSATDGSAFRTKFSAMATQAKNKAGENYDGSVRQRGEQAVSAIIKDGGPFTKGKLEELASLYLRNKDGSPITGLDIPAGGKRGIKTHAKRR